MDALTRAFTSRGFAFSYFPTANEAARYIASACAGKSVSLGGSMTFQEMGFPEAFADSTEVHWHWVTKGEYYQTPDIYLTSANAQRLGTRTPCAADGKCHECKSPARICRALVVHMGAPKGFEKCEIVLVGESLGY